MATLRFQLLGKFNVQRDARPLKSLDASKEQELLCYLLVRRDRPHPREALASLLWGDSSTEKSKKYLRQALWHLQAALEESEKTEPRVLLVEHDWVQLNLHSESWLDVAAFESALTATQGAPGHQLAEAGARLLKSAVELYKGDLLDGWYQDWCLFERERLQNIYLSMLDKLMNYSHAHGEYEAGQQYGATILRYDRASERTYRRLMRMQYLSGDRTGALRSYERCANTLREELGVKPGSLTKALYEEIRADGIDRAAPVKGQPDPLQAAPLPEVLGRLKRLQLDLAAIQERVRRDIMAVELGLKTKKQ